ncbi:MAG: hypothetical protein WBE37_07840 [Bryobacteraceae bacterium]
MNRIIPRFKVVVKSALLLKGGLSGGAIFIAETLVGSDVHVELIVDVGIRSSYVDHAKVDEITGFFQNVGARTAFADFLIDRSIVEGEGAQ